MTRCDEMWGYAYGLQIWHTCSKGQFTHDPQKFSQKGAWPGSRDTLNFWALNANSSKTVKPTDFKFDTCFQGQSRQETQKFSQKGAWPESRDPLNFWALNANSSKTVTPTDLKFDTRVHRDSSHMTPKNFPKSGRGHGHVTPKFLGVKCQQLQNG